VVVFEVTFSELHEKAGFSYTGVADNYNFEYHVGVLFGHFYISTTGTRGLKGWVDSWY
jgi:hypothetical protein